MKREYRVEKFRAEMRRSGMYDSFDASEKALAEMKRRGVCDNAVSPVTAHVHAPRILLKEHFIIGCTCGWVTPRDAENSDDAYIEHAAYAMVAR